MSPTRSIELESQLLRVNGLEIAMRVVGEGEPLLLMNGMTRPLQSWEPFTREMGGRTIVSFDAPGLGASPTPVVPLSIPALAAVAVAVLDAAGLDDADLLGFSHGGAVAQQLAADVPGKVRRLVLVSTSCGAGATPSRGRAVLRALGAPDDHPWPRADPWGVLWQSLAFSSWSSIPFLGAISASTLVVCGTHDRVVPPANSRVLVGRIPDASLVMVPGGHDLQRPEQARTLARIVEEFLSPQARVCAHGEAPTNMSARPAAAGNRQPRRRRT
jgi:pimeloyl-ACP methyl ester carboxylesterase